MVAAFCGSACLFLIELFAGKWLLPQFGGAPGVWIACLAFFQTVLVAAYFYAHRLTRLMSPRRQVALQAALFVLMALVTFLGVGLRLPAGTSGRVPLPLVVLVMLAVAVGPAFFIVATLAPLFGHWGTLRDGRAENLSAGNEQKAYALYAAGNAGSFAGLIVYPLVLEPAAGLTLQATCLMVLYGAVGVLAVASGWLLVSGGGGEAGGPDSGAAVRPSPEQPVGWSTWLRWGLLAALPSSWLASVTTHATVEVAPIPLLWILPLAAYLASFVVVFSPGGRSLRRYEPLALVLAVGAVSWMLACAINQPAWPVIVVHLLIFFVVCVALHGTLVDERPPPEQLTSLYLAMAVGGACGGLANALLAPLVFDAHYEFPLGVAAVAAIMPPLREGLGSRVRWLAAAVAAASLFMASGMVPGLQVPRGLWFVLVAAAVCVAVVVMRRWERGLAVAALVLGFFWLGEANDRVLHRERTFFGVLRVRADANGPSRQLIHGNISHGVQLVSADPERRRIPLSYYHQTGPLGSIFTALSEGQRVRRIGVAGLGVGTVASYIEPGQECVFFEIDPAVVGIATNPDWFTFLADCRGRTRLVVDDARKALAREPDAAIDLLVIDAFTGDSVPTHLLTREALALYGRKVSADGVVAIHISNRYLDFVPIIEAVAADGGWMALDGHDLDVPSDYARVGSHWMALSRSLDSIQQIYVHPTSDRWRWQPVAERPSRRPWTDDLNAVSEALR
jgi:spermidine synthase